MIDGHEVHYQKMPEWYKEVMNMHQQCKFTTLVSLSVISGCFIQKHASVVDDSKSPSDEKLEICRIPFDQAWFILLRHSRMPWESERESTENRQRNSSFRLFRSDGQPRDDQILGAIIMDLDIAMVVARIVGNPSSYGGGTCECEYHFGAFVFYQQGKPVFEVIPNFSGGDLEFHPAPNFQHESGMTTNAYNKLTHISFELAATMFCEDLTTPMPPPSKVAIRIQQHQYHERRIFPGRKELQKCLPQDYSKMAKEVTDSTIGAISKENQQIQDQKFRAFFTSGTKEMYTTLFQILGCLHMPWNRRYHPEQTAAYDFMIRAPRDELNSAINEAARSQDSIIRRGACRLVFTSSYMMTNYSKTNEDIQKWMVLLAQEAFQDTYADNRRLVISRLLDVTDANILKVFILAATDPEQTVRRRAMEALSKYQDPVAKQVLKEIAEGKLKYRIAPAALPRDLSKGAAAFTISGMEEEEFKDSDSDAAKDLLRSK